MPNGDNTEDVSPIHRETANGEKATQSEIRQPSSDKPGNDAQLANAGPLDRGTTAWLVVLGAWCCSFTSPGWVNSTYQVSVHFLL